MGTLSRIGPDRVTIISIAVFYRQLGWHNIVLNCIEPFAEITKELQYYFLSMDVNRGEHIKLFLATSESEAKTLALKAGVHFQDFLIQHPMRGRKKYVSSVFLDFESNTVHYGVYDTFGFAFSNADQLQRELTKLIILVFRRYGKKTIVNLVEIMLGFFAHFQDSANLDKYKVIELFEGLLSIEQNRYTGENLKRIEMINDQNFHENKEAIVDFLKSGELGSTELELHEKKWRCIVENYQDYVGTNQERKYCYLIDSLCNAFGFTDKIDAYYLFSRALKYT